MAWVWVKGKVQLTWLVIVGGWIVVLLTTGIGGHYLLLSGSIHKFSATHTKADYALVSILFLVILLLSQQPVVAVLVSIVFLTLILVVNNAKVRALQEPLVFSDFALFSQVFKYPRLYLPFIKIKWLVFLLAGFLGGIFWKLLSLGLFARVELGWLEWLVNTMLLVSLLGYVWKRSRSEVQMADPLIDIRKIGLLGSLVWGGMQAAVLLRRTEFWQGIRDSSPFAGNLGNRRVTHRQANIIAVQSESFFDARRLHKAVMPYILQHFDRIKTEAWVSGRLEVSAWGANTMRTEFAFLSGIAESALGVHKYYPYQSLADHGVPSLVACLKALGYVCICIHPHQAGFFRRDKVFPQLGFDEFIDIGAFADAVKVGSYVSDEAVTGKVLEVLQEWQVKASQTPVFIFVITMENHGPLHLESVQTGEEKVLLGEPLGCNAHDLVVYLRHLRNADQMLKTLTDALRVQEQEAVLCFYGDHVPSMPDVYAGLGYTQAATDYLVWHSHKTTRTRQQNIRPEELGRLMLEAGQIRWEAE